MESERERRRKQTDRQTGQDRTEHSTQTDRQKDRQTNRHTDARFDVPWSTASSVRRAPPRACSQTLPAQAATAASAEGWQGGWHNAPVHHEPHVPMAAGEESVHEPPVLHRAVARSSMSPLPYGLGCDIRRAHPFICK